MAATLLQCAPLERDHQSRYRYPEIHGTPKHIAVDGIFDDIQKIESKNNITSAYRAVTLTPSEASGCPCGSVVEHSLGKGEVGSSILPMGTTD